MIKVPWNIDASSIKSRLIHNGNTEMKDALHPLSQECRTKYSLLVVFRISPICEVVQNPPPFCRKATSRTFRITFRRTCEVVPSLYIFLCEERFWRARAISLCEPHVRLLYDRSPMGLRQEHEVFAECPATNCDSVFVLRFLQCAIVKRLSFYIDDSFQYLYLCITYYIY